MMAFALMPSGSIDSDIEDATREELPARPQSISDRRRISSTAASLLDDEEEEKTGPGLIYESDDSNSSCKFPDGKNGYSKEDHALQTKEFMSINGIAEGMTSLFCSPSLEETDRTDSAVTLIDPQNASELDMSNLHSSTGMGGISRISSPEPLNNSQRSLSMVDEANQHLVGCTDMDLEGVREIIAKDVSAVLGTSGAAVQWVVDLNAWLMGMNERPYKMTGSSRRKLRNRCGIRGAQAQRLQRLWSNWHSNTGEAMSSPQTYEGRPKNASENPNMPPQPIWSISVTRSLDDAELVSSSAVPIKNRWSESVDKPVSDIQCVTSAPSIAPPPPDVAVQPDLYYDSDPEIFRQASRTSPKAASSPTNKPIRRRRQISISGASDNTTSVEGQSKRLRRQIPIPDAIDTVASVGSRDFGAPPAPRNFLGKGAPSFDMMPSFDNCVNMPDEDVVHEFIKDLALQKTNLIWHSSMEGSASDKDSAAPTKCRSPVSVQAWFELGSRLPSALVQPKFMWRETYQPDLLNHKRLGTTFRKPDALDILSMIRIVKPTSIDRTLYPFVKLDQSFTILTHTNEVHVFEAPSPQERDWLVHGLKLAVARLASMIIVGDDQMFVEFFSPWAYTPVVEDTPEPSINIQLQDEERDGTPNGVFISTTDRERGDLWGLPR